LLFVVYVKAFLPNVGDAPNLKIESTPERIARGEYLANHVMMCIDCHSVRDYSKYSGPVTGKLYVGGSEDFTKETGLPGNFYPGNLTPFHLKNWTDGEIYRAITTGVRKNGKALFPVMPYHLYGQAADEDIHAVIAYLRTLPEVENQVKTSKADFPVSFFLNMMPKKQKQVSKPNPADKLAYGKYMATIAGCIECHTPLVKGQPVWEEAYTGGREFIMPIGVVRTSNLTPHKLTGIGEWTEEIFVDQFRMFADSSNVMSVPEGGFNTPMPWTLYSKMHDEDLKAIFAFLQSLPPVEKQIVKFTPKK
jgi:mono/diheme cytochrome c family protein